MQPAGRSGGVNFIHPFVSGKTISEDFSEVAREGGRGCSEMMCAQPEPGTESSARLHAVDPNFGPSP